MDTVVPDYDIEIYYDSTEHTLAYRERGTADDRWSVRPKRRQAVRWTCDLGSYALVFGDLSPFPETSYAAKAGDPITATVPKKKTSGIYKYSVIVFRGNGEAPLVDDPQVCID